MNFADRVTEFNRHLTYTGGPLPDGIRMMNPFRENIRTMGIVEAFYQKYYNDNLSRHLILGINPGRFGGGLTGIPFTDPKRLVSVCHIPYSGKVSHEPSSVFVYEMIDAYGGPEAFYKDFYINSPCPLGLASIDQKGKETNYNYYDSRELTEAVYPFIIENICKQIELGIQTDTCFCLGTGKNEKFLRKVNEEYQFFHQLIALEHPRFIMQYKSTTRHLYIDKYIAAFNRIIE